MAYSEANKRATMKYQKKAYDRLELKVKKGDKAKITKRATELKKSVNTYIKDLINADTDNMLQDWKGLNMAISMLKLKDIMDKRWGVFNAKWSPKKLSKQMG